MWFSKSGSLPENGKIGKRDGVHWRMPTAMALCWFIGLGLAIGHHFYYYSLAIGHHFYYYSLDGTIVPGQSQQEWALRIGTGMAFLTKTFLTTAVGIACVQNLWWILRWKPVRMSTLDSMWDIRGSIFNLFDLHIWLRGPNVALLGLISWCIPLVTVVTPSTLSVRPMIGAVTHQQQMPVIDFDFDKFYTMDDGGPAGPSPAITRFVAGGVIQGTILTVPAAPAPNSSYTLSFTGPLIQCINSSDYVSQQVQDWAQKHGEHYTSFMAFEPSSDNMTIGLDILNNADTHYSYEDYEMGDENADVAGKLVLAIWPFMNIDERWVVECGMYNASYTVNFNFTNSIQSTEVTNLEVLNRVLAHRQHEMPRPDNEDQLFAFTGMMSAFTDVLVGTCQTVPSRCSGTQLYSTALIESQQIWDLVYGSDKTLKPTNTSLRSIVDVASELGKNLTLSFFSNPFFLNTTRGPMVNVTVYPNQTEYLYSQRNLLIAYGISVFVSLLCIITGLLTMWDNGFAFSDSLSTILRATRSKKFDEIVPDDSTTGSDPPPESLSNTRVQWVPLGGRDDSVAGLMPLPANAEPEKAEERSPRSPISFSNRIQERKSYQPTVSRVNTSPDGYI
ncbi:uncharacterized protein BJX67DRAFT_306669 [Aspergillus lucknowensis]|uniref:Uncharacterized protein n=1 Tax=Aspergillus lucknowensis TaxID=176173 RepID=A0ABR4M011_9EURO